MYVLCTHIGCLADTLKQMRRNDIDLTKTNYDIPKPTNVKYS